jgi:hypothetical protein
MRRWLLGTYTIYITITRVSIWLVDVTISKEHAVYGRTTKACGIWTYHKRESYEGELHKRESYMRYMDVPQKPAAVREPAAQSSWGL